MDESFLFLLTYKTFINDTANSVKNMLAFVIAICIINQYKWLQNVLATLYSGEYTLLFLNVSGF